MTAPQYPYHPYYLPPQPPRRRHSSADVIVTVIMCTLAAGAAALGLMYSLFFAMATDACSTQCNEAALGWAYLVTWGGIAAAALLAFAGVIIAASRGRTLWIWPTSALVLIAVATTSGALLADSVIPGH